MDTNAERRAVVKRAAGTQGAGSKLSMTAGPSTTMGASLSVMVLVTVAGVRHELLLSLFAPISFRIRFLDFRRVYCSLW